MTFTAAAADIDELGHVNNTVWLLWVQEIATAHWQAVAAPEHVRDLLWVVTRHEIDYRGNIGTGETVEARTFIPDPPRGARFDRCVEFRRPGGPVLVAARSTWALIERSSGRPMRVRDDVAAPFRAATGPGSGNGGGGS
ncbi:acyl-CoA thioesterase [Erythrobacteraceae bacterium CFH 75059]|uniref:acyl-CoA thioesterase n=1 Tax=Qipengyuania thermophila TaxID=2509361 RepID=UPI0010201523|nr:acyl-CoA thioesterase [Qipengyuania thermophila]TCD06939.1 acyl-CoA thioesterase [Erythrobacteraceae bacterium CFH 75059]